MFGKLMSISDELMWRTSTLLWFRSEAEIAALQREVDGGRNPRDAKVLLAKEIVARFHGAAAADAAEADFDNRGARRHARRDRRTSRSSGAPLGIGALLKQARLAPSTSEALRLIDGGGVRVDGAVVSDNGLKLASRHLSSCRSASASSRASRCAEPRRDAAPCRSTDAAAPVASRSRWRATIAMKTAAWWITGSVGLLSDAMESLVNLASALFALAMVTIARAAGRRRPSVRPQQGRVLLQRASRAC